MYDFLLLPALGLITASFFTAIGDRFLATKLPGWPLGRRLALASLATPTAWIASQALVLAIILPQPSVYTGLMSKWPLYLQDVLIGIALKLWICGAICAAVLACYRNVARDPQLSQGQARAGLLNIGGALAAAILLPPALDHWIESGQLGGAFVLFVMAWAFLLGGLPIAAAALALLRLAGQAGLRRFGEPIAAIYAAVVAWRGYAWHSAVLGRPGASAVILVEFCAFAGVLTAWFAIRRANHVAAEANAAGTKGGTAPPPKI
jgi:hypothetical protein